ncbi:glycoside hydrolase family protein [Azorhizophilus paspali]|uniref:Lysozyme n=1 Tax=Azorhizophilus paspali TaxID=69963 RepID=A0ABV6SN13_AZOPA
MSSLLQMLAYEEGFRSEAYLDSLGYPTIGYGFLLAKTKCTPAELAKYYDFVLPKNTALVWLDGLSDQLARKLRKDERFAPAWNSCNGLLPRPFTVSPRQAVLVSMAYQLGVEGLAKFKTTLKYAAHGQFSKASQSMLKSLWAEQDPGRARRHATQMESGAWYLGYTGES